MAATPGWDGSAHLLYQPSSTVLVDGVRPRIGVSNHRGRRNRGIAVPIAVEEIVGDREVEVLDHGAAHLRLVVIVAHRIFVGEPLEIGSVAVIDIVEGGGRAAAVAPRRLGRGDEGIEVVQAAAGIFLGGVRGAAVGLLPHLKKAVDRIAGIGIIRQHRAGQPERPVGQSQRVGDPQIHAVPAGVVGGSRGQEDAVGRLQIPLHRRGRRDRGERRRIGIARLARRAPELGRRQRRIRRLGLGADVIARLAGRAVLRRRREIRAGRAVLLDNSLRQQVRDSLAGARLIEAEDVIEGAVLADDDDHVPDGARGARLFRGCAGAEDAHGKSQRRRGGAHEAAGPHASAPRHACPSFLRPPKRQQ